MIFKTEIQKTGELLGLEGQFLIDWGFEQVYAAIIAQSKVAEAARALMVSEDPALNGVMHPLEIALDDAVTDWINSGY